MPTPRETYERRLADRRARVERMEQLDRRLSAARGIVFVAGLVLWGLVVVPELLPPWVLAVPALVFLAIVVGHERVVRAAALARRSAAFHERGLARLDGTWPGGGDPGDDLLDPDHPYAADLDVLGRGSLFELVSAARTAGGRARLASWLLAAAAPDEIRRRQEAVAELAAELDLREQVALVGEDVRRAADDRALLRWASEPPVGWPAGSRAVTLLLAFANVGGLVIWITWSLSDPFLLSAAASALWAAGMRSRVATVLAGVERAGRELPLVAELLRRIEQGRFRSPWLRDLQQSLLVEGLTPSHEIAALTRRLDLLDARRNQLFLPLSLPLLWTTQLAQAIGAWRRRCGPAIPRWTSAVADFEAMCSLAGYAFEHPGDVFPEIAETGGPRLAAEQAAHPLLPQDRAVRNDVELGAVRLLLVSGSNMSGKSTLLRTVGTNAVLALAGAPVRARRLILSPLRIGASIRVHDSLLEGSSRFFAEITRLRRLVDLSREPPPLLFLLDEVLHGTNSADRKAGAEAIVRGLLDRGAMGLVTTHDLALAASADELGPLARNVHFEDRLEEDGRLSFDYRLRPGVVQRSNAMALMRAVGLLG